MKRVWVVCAVVLGIFIGGARGQQESPPDKPRPQGVAASGKVYTIIIKLKRGTNPTDCKLLLVADTTALYPANSTPYELALTYTPPSGTQSGTGDEVTWIDGTGSTPSHRIVVTFAAAQSGSPFGTTDYTLVGATGTIPSPPVVDLGATQLGFAYDILYDAGQNANGAEVVCFIDPMIIVKK